MRDAFLAEEMIDNPPVDDMLLCLLGQYQKLRTSTIQFRELLQRYLGQIAELHEITERLSMATEGFFIEGDPNNGLGTSFREFCWESRYGLITHFVDGIKKGERHSDELSGVMDERLSRVFNDWSLPHKSGVLDPFNLWQREIDKAQEYVDVSSTWFDGHRRVVGVILDAWLVMFRGSKISASSTIITDSRFNN